jgi:hypothetical protein
MPDAPAFFLPAATTENQEEAFAGLATWASRAVPEFGDRVFSITFVHDGEEWVATVGEQLRGTRLPSPRSRAKKRQHPVALHDPAVVLAIFPGVPYIVVTNHRIGGNVGSLWENPFFAGEPRSLTRFRHP